MAQAGGPDGAKADAALAAIEARLGAGLRASLLKIPTCAARRERPLNSCHDEAHARESSTCSRIMRGKRGPVWTQPTSSTRPGCLSRRDRRPGDGCHRRAALPAPEDQHRARLPDHGRHSRTQGARRARAQFPALGWFTITSPEGLAPLAELGIVFLLFLIGLELSPKRLVTMRRLVFGLGVLQVALSATCIGLILSALGYDAAAATIIGLSLALSSTAVVVEILSRQQRLKTATGRASFSILLVSGSGRRAAAAARDYSRPRSARFYRDRRIVVVRPGGARGRADRDRRARLL